MKALQVFERNNKRIITFLRCGHRYIKELRDKNENPFFNQSISIFNEENTQIKLFPYEGKKTFFIIRNPFEHLISSLIFSMDTWHLESLRFTFTDFYLLEPKEKIRLVIEEMYYQRSNYHWIPNRYETIYKMLCEENRNMTHFEFIELHNLTNFVKKEFKVTGKKTEKDYDYQFYEKDEVIKWITEYKSEKFEKMLKKCEQEDYYYNLLKNNQIKKEKCHDYPDYFIKFENNLSNHNN